MRGVSDRRRSNTLDLAGKVRVPRGCGPFGNPEKTGRRGFPRYQKPSPGMVLEGDEEPGLDERRFGIARKRKRKVEKCDYFDLDKPRKICYTLFVGRLTD